jgi:hypothetical protein
MHLLAIVLIVLTRSLLVLPLLLLWWALVLAKGLVLAIGDTGLFLVRLFIGGVLRPLGHRYALLAAVAAVFVAGATMPELQNPSFYVVLVVALVACFLAGKFGKLLLPKSAPSYAGMIPPLPGLPRWPPLPKARPRRPIATPTPEPLRPRNERPAEPPPMMPTRPLPSPVHVMAAAGAIPSPSEQEAVAGLPEALQRLMRPRSEAVSGGTAAGKTAP